MLTLYIVHLNKNPQANLLIFFNVHNEQVKITALDKLQLIYAYR